MAKLHRGRRQGLPSFLFLTLHLTHSKLLDELEPIVADGSIILDWHTCEAFPERWADLVVVLTCDHTQLWDRLEKRFVFIAIPTAYSDLKLEGTH